ncbi:efflux transporter outer membrane subunit [Acidisoma silvae]|uniref:Efflux transporter outer membrane subunit n=1 Tax=Acidisoma silvae TaxID=2802396 RepID=A0A963YQI5_9PROT|nr:efflux transporter outer membrane subunit [Acidisoma silvae]MCB8875276.1 efflux transporter outer membrane subunit [Acidisoma silvae]
MTRLLRLGLLGLLAGCTLGPDYHPPAIPPTATGDFVSAGNASLSADPLPDGWWQLYQDPRLNSLILQAFAANDDIKVAEANLAASRALFEGARALQLPQTSIGGTATYGRDVTLDTVLEVTGREPQDSWLFDTTFDMAYEVDLFGQVRREVEAARDNAQAVAAALDGLRVTIAAETARAYGSVCALGEQIAVAQRSLAITADQLRIVQASEAAGGSTDFDVARSKTLVAQVQATLPPLEGQRRAAIFEIAALLGETPAQAPFDLESCTQPPQLAAPVPVGDGAAMLKRRPDVRAADRKLATALAEIGAAKADLFPKVSLTGFFGGAATQFNLLGSNSGLTWGVGPAISWTFPNLAGPLAKLAQTRANARGALASFDGTVLTALKETEQALTAYEAELGHHAALADAATDARHALTLAQAQFTAGQISNLDLLTSEQSQVTTAAALAASDAALIQDQVALFKALGGGWQATAR